MQQSYFPPGDYTSGHVLYRWACSRCERSAHESRKFCRGEAIWIPSALPEGWNKVGEQIFCPDHKVLTFVDDKLLGTEGQA